MDYLYIKKPKNKGEPKMHWTKIITDENRPFTFDEQSLNFNTFIRAFARNILQRQYLERHVCNYYLIENGDVRLCDKRPDILEDEDKLHHYVNKVWRLVTNLMVNIGQL